MIIYEEMTEIKNVAFHSPTCTICHAPLTRPIRWKEGGRWKFGWVGCKCTLKKRSKYFPTDAELLKKNKFKFWGKGE